MFYHFMDGTITICKLRDYFKWPKVSLMGHSLGSVMSFTYGSLFPDTVDFVVCIDALVPLVYNNRIERTITSIEEFLKYDSLNSSGQEPPLYTKEEAAQVLHDGTFESIALENCKYILDRNTTESKVQPGKYYFSRDPRLKCGPILGWTKEDVLTATARVDFPVFLILNDGNPFKAFREVNNAASEILKKKDNFEFYGANGTHHAHLNDPQQFADLMSPFLKKNYKGDEMNVLDKVKIVNKL